MGGTLYLLSDFGEKDCYVAQMKASVLSFTGGDITMVDITHSVKPGSVRQGAFLLMSTIPFLSEGSVVLAVVDPGVGTERRGIVCRVGEVLVVTPDNGLPSWIEPEDIRYLPPPEAGASPTFHGRDWFAPMAARFMVNPGWMGFLEPCFNPVTLRRGESRLSRGVLATSVAHVDSFGNCILWTPSEQVEGFTPGTLKIRGISVPVVPSRVYDSGEGGILFIQGSQGFSELAVAGGSAEATLDLSPGDEIVLEE